MAGALIYKRTTTARGVTGVGRCRRAAGMKGETAQGSERRRDRLIYKSCQPVS